MKSKSILIWISSAPKIKLAQPHMNSKKPQLSQVLTKYRRKRTPVLKKDLLSRIPVEWKRSLTEGKQQSNCIRPQKDFKSCMSNSASLSFCTKNKKSSTVKHEQGSQKDLKQSLKFFQHEVTHKFLNCETRWQCANDVGLFQSYDRIT